MYSTQAEILNYVFEELNLEDLPLDYVTDFTYD